MKDPLHRTKVVLRHLPPSISQSGLMEQIDVKFSGRYNWFVFRPGKQSQKNQRFSRAYIDFQNPEDVVDFAEFFDGHIFVNEKGSQFKALVEYAPSQRVPMLLPKKDGREGTISKDPEYVEFLEFIAKPVENLPSAEIQLERRETERAGGPKEAVIVTPLMDFIRQKRLAKTGSQRLSVNGKLSRRAGGSVISSSGSSKRGSEKRRGSTSVYVPRDKAKASSSGKVKSTYVLMLRKDEQQLGSGSRKEVLEEGTVAGLNGTMPVASGSVEIGNRRVLLKGKEREASHVSDGYSQQQNTTASVGNLTASSSSKQIQRHEASGRNIRRILLNKVSRHSQSYSAGAQHEQQTQDVSSQKDKRPPRPPNRLGQKDHISIAAQSSIPYNDGKGSTDDKVVVNNLNGSSIGDKNEKRMRNKDRPDRGVWTPHRADGVNTNGSVYLSAPQLSESSDGIYMSHEECGTNSRAAYDAPLSHEEIRSDLPNLNRNAESRSGRVNISPVENGAHRYAGRRGLPHGMKELDGSPNLSEGKTSKKAVSAGFGSYEKQVWVQKSGAGS
ncbi:regulator of nonsense transcripts UPF3-like isoform X1 [Asparagus officinalis]|uniref:regulator of nonsense transcripts UPF3-like isoform X1 n=1 Tax=Asparagus officinalis TaxID=4686 RepID=UPI00098E8347|nr:regulator of nonsense transcripts UPF3-like isoform X1 [Asparagus officinalis]